MLENTDESLEKRAHDVFWFGGVFADSWSEEARKQGKNGHPGPQKAPRFTRKLPPNPTEGWIWGDLDDAGHPWSLAQSM
jgi:hypothetical protein